MYSSFLRPFLFKKDAEAAHEFVFRQLERFPWLAKLQAIKSQPRHKISAFGLYLPNAVGLAAGLDKNGILTPVWQKLGFGFAEVGTVTPLPQEGNPKPRLFRLPMDQALINRMGFNNAGVAAMAKNLENKPKYFTVGVNIGKNKQTENANAHKDYVLCFERLYDFANYFVVNVSSPNTPGLRELQEKDALSKILDAVQNRNHSKPEPRPILLKIAPDLTNTQLDDIVAIVKETKLAGVIATNTTIDRSRLKTPAAEVEAIGAGGLSGAPLFDRANEVVRYLTDAGIETIGVGGINDGASAKARRAAGARLVQVYTGFIYKGPRLLKEILEEI